MWSLWAGVRERQSSPDSHTSRVPLTLELLEPWLLDCFKTYMSWGLTIRYSIAGSQVQSLSDTHLRAVKLFSKLISFLTKYMFLVLSYLTKYNCSLCYLTQKITVLLVFFCRTSIWWVTAWALRLWDMPARRFRGWRGPKWGGSLVSASHRLQYLDMKIFSFQNEAVST